jgi:hypothetical protein
MRRYEPALLLACTMSAAGLSFADIQHPVRTAVTLFFLAFVPGLAITRAIRLEGLEARLVLAVPTSLGLAAVVSAAFVYFGVPSWDLGLSVLISITVGAVAADLARGAIPAHRAGRFNRSKLDDEGRQAAIVHTLVEGGSLADAAQAAAVSTATLQRALQRSKRLRMAASVASHGELDSPDDASDTENRARARGR